MRLVVIIVLLAGCRFVTAETAQIARPRIDPDHIVLLVEAPGAYGALEQRLIATLARDPHIDVKQTPPGVDACAAVDSGAADAIVRLALGHSPATVALTIEKPVLRKGRSQHFCHPTSVLVDEPLARAESWIVTHLDAKTFGVDTEMHAGELAVGANAGVRPGDAFSIGDNGYALATEVTPTTAHLEPLWDSTRLTDTRVDGQDRPWVLTMQPHGGVARLDDGGMTETAVGLGFDVRVSKLASGPIFGVGYDAVIGDRHDLMFVGPQVGWAWRVNSTLELHAIGEPRGGLAGTTKPDGTHALGAGGMAELGATWNTRSVFTSLDFGYAYSSTFEPDPISRVDQRGPFARLAFGFSAFH